MRFHVSPFPNTAQATKEIANLKVTCKLPDDEVRHTNSDLKINDILTKLK